MLEEKRDYIETTFVTYKMVYEFLINIIIQRWEAQNLESTHGTQINGPHKKVTNKELQVIKGGENYIRWAEDEEKLSGEGGLRYGHIRIK